MNLFEFEIIFRIQFEGVANKRWSTIQFSYVKSFVKWKAYFI